MNPSLNQFISHAKALYSQLRDAEDALYGYLYRGESEWVALWSSTGHTYDTFLQECGILSSREAIGRYRTWLETKTQKVDKDTVLADYIPEIGIDAVIEASRLKTPATRLEAVHRAQLHIETNGTKPSQATARAHVKEIKTIEAAAKTRGASYPTLAEKCEKLAAENKRLKSENAALRAEIAALKRTHQLAA